MTHKDPCGFIGVDGPLIIQLPTPYLLKYHHIFCPHGLQGCSSFITSQFKVPFYCGSGDRESVEGKGRVIVGPRYHPMHWLPHHLWSGKPVTVTETLRVSIVVKGES